MDPAPALVLASGILLAAAGILSLFAGRARLASVLAGLAALATAAAPVLAGSSEPPDLLVASFVTAGALAFLAASFAARLRFRRRRWARLGFTVGSLPYLWSVARALDSLSPTWILAGNLAMFLVFLVAALAPNLLYDPIPASLRARMHESGNAASTTPGHPSPFTSSAGGAASARSSTFR
jgi:hypothetical protein